MPWRIQANVYNNKIFDWYYYWENKEIEQNKRVNNDSKIEILNLKSLCNSYKSKIDLVKENTGNVRNVETADIEIKDEINLKKVIYILEYFKCTSYYQYGLLIF